MIAQQSIAIFWLLSLSGSLIGLAIAPSRSMAQPDSSCPPPVLSRLQTHQVRAGETLEAIATQYQILPAILLHFNPALQESQPSPGGQLSIPPLNGIKIAVPSGATWQDLAEAYGVRADVLFELNGCQFPGETAFIPGTHWTQASPQTANYLGLSGYPLRDRSAIGLTYGWQTREGEDSEFHNGIDFLAPPGTSVLAAESGIVAFADRQGNYGNLVVINHEGGRQTRYAHLDTFNVTPNQEVRMGEIIGTVGTSGQPDIPQSHLHFEVRYQVPIGWVAQDPQIHLLLDLW
ncbi:MAG: M23 family metallopeptidase [Cyanobacteria bacterium SBLK]|nr:M23 family metallopeptidase [Cyanobacteria bacterium SBLK]